MSELTSRDFYLIQNEGIDFFTGHTSDGRQVLLGCLSNEFLTGIFFDTHGNLIGSQNRPTSGLNPYDPRLVEKVSASLDAWWKELGFAPGTIRVRRFDCKEAGVRIEDLPDYLEEFLQDPEGFAQNKQESASSYFESGRRWRESGQFVLWWAKDYWLDGGGAVEST